jgi:hypothetical protein
VAGTARSAGSRRTYRVTAGAKGYGEKLPQPIFDPKIIDEREVALIISHHGVTQRYCVSGYKQVVGTHGLACSLQSCSQLTINDVDGASSTSTSSAPNTASSCAISRDEACVGEVGKQHFCTSIIVALKCKP